MHRPETARGTRSAGGQGPVARLRVWELAPMTAAQENRRPMAAERRLSAAELPALALVHCQSGDCHWRAASLGLVAWTNQRRSHLPKDFCMLCTIPAIPGSRGRSEEH